MSEDFDEDFETVNDTKAAFLDFFTSVLLDFDHKDLKDLTLMHMTEYVDAWVDDNFCEDEEIYDDEEIS